MRTIYRTKLFFSMMLPVTFPNKIHQRVSFCHIITERVISWELENIVSKYTNLAQTFVSLSHALPISIYLKEKRNYCNQDVKLKEKEKEKEKGKKKIKLTLISLLSQEFQKSTYNVWPNWRFQIKRKILATTKKIQQEKQKPRSQQST